MVGIQFETLVDDDTRRRGLYRGEIFVYGARGPAVALCAFARKLIEEAFAPLDPETAQHSLPVEQYAQILGELKPRFIHHPECKRLIRALLLDQGCDPEGIYFDVPRLRTSTSDGYLTTGIAYAFHPHRDMWYSAPSNQLNWWLPVYPIEVDNGMALYPRYFGRAVLNNSEVYDYERWNQTSRFDAAKHIGTDTRVQPHALEELDLSEDLRVVTPPGGLTIFSSAQLHASVENRTGRTRFSLDFRTVHRGDAEAGVGAPNVDSRSTGTAMGDYLRISDLTPLPDELIASYRSGALR